MGLSRTVRRRDDGWLDVALTGSIDEATDLDALLADLPQGGGGVRLDLSGIDRLNSIGIHRWIPRFEAFARQRPTTIEGLSYAVVMQTNCITNLFAGATVRSCVAPYYCAGCDVAHAVRVDASEVQPGRAPGKRCPTCGAAMQFDELPGYFQCLLPTRLISAGPVR